MTTKKRWLYIPVEIKVRAYHARLLLACAAADAGYGVVLGSQRELLEAIRHLAPGIYFDKCISSYKVKSLQKITDHGHQIAALDEEGFVYADPDSWAQLRASEQTLALTRAVMTWGQAQYDIFAKHYPQTMDKIHLTGNPRMDLLRPELREFYRAQADAITKEHGRFIFVPSNFAAYINANGTDFIFKQYHAFGLTPNDEKRKELLGQIQFTARLFYHMLLAIDRLATKFPQHRIVVRPHPGDDHHLWKNLLACYPNVFVEFKGTIEPYLLAADVIVHNGCTSAIQAVLMDRLVLAYQPVTDEHFDQKLPNSISQCIADLDELEHQVNAMLNGPSQDAQTRTHNKILAHHIESLQGDFAYQKIMGCLDQIEIQPRSFAYARIRNWLSNLPRRSARGTLTKFPNRFRVAEKYERQKFPGLKLGEVRQDIKKLQKTAQAFSNITTSQISRNLFRIEGDGKR